MFLVGKGKRLILDLGILELYGIYELNHNLMSRNHLFFFKLNTKLIGSF